MQQQKSDQTLQEHPEKFEHSLNCTEDQQGQSIISKKQLQQQVNSRAQKTKQCNQKQSKMIISLQLIVIVILLCALLRKTVWQSNYQNKVHGQEQSSLSQNKNEFKQGKYYQTKNNERDKIITEENKHSKNIGTLSVIEQLPKNKKLSNSDLPTVEQIQKAYSTTSEQKTDKMTYQRSKFNHFSESQSSFDWPSDMSDYNMSESFNLWDVTPEQKTAWLKRYKELPQSKKPRMTENYLDISYDKDGDFEEQAKSYEANTEVINWADIQLTEQQKVRIESEFNAIREKRREKITNLFNKYKKMYMNKQGAIPPTGRKITYQQFLESLEYEQLLGEDFKNDPKFKAIFEKEKKYYESKYKVQDYPNELRACIVCPSYRNVPDYRYAWNIESIMQQDYSNFRVIVIDDASPDKTGEVLSKYLRWRNFPRDKIVLLRNRAQRTSIENVYYAVHKYCDFNQIFYTVDGDDEMAGTQVLRLFNSLYQSKKYYTMYSNFLSYWYRRQAPLSVGGSYQYDQQTKQKNNYKHVRHAYSHLRTMMTDIFLLTKDESYKDWDGKFYWTVPDNAVYYAAMEMSCGRVQYIPQMMMWYNVQTGYSEISTSRQAERNKINDHIINSQKRYHCVNNYFEVIRSVLANQGKDL